MLRYRMYRLDKKIADPTILIRTLTSDIEGGWFEPCGDGILTVTDCLCSNFKMKKCSKMVSTVAAA